MLMNILFFGPNGSGKGTQGDILKKKYGLPHIESGAIFRENISNGTELGSKAKEYIDKGDLVPDDITIPMILDRLKRSDCKDGWLKSARCTSSISMPGGSCWLIAALNQCGETHLVQKMSINSA